MIAYLRTLVVALLTGILAGCSITPPRDVFEEDEIRALQGELAGSVEYKTAVHFLVDKEVWSAGETGPRSFSVPLEWESVREDLYGVIRKFGLFKEVVGLNGANAGTPEEEVLDKARKEEADLVVIMKPLKTEVRYDGRDYLLWAADLVLWTFLWFPAYLIPDEKFSVELGIEMRVLDAYSGREVYRKCFTGSESRTLDDFSRGFGILDIWSPVLAQWTLGEKNYRKVSKSLMPHAMTQVKKTLLKDLAVDFVASLQTPEVQGRITPKQRRVFAVVVGAGNPRGVAREMTRFSEDDARAFWERLLRYRDPAVDRDGSALLTGDAASASGIRKALKAVKARFPKPDDDVVFYFSGLGALGKGEGGSEPFLVASDTNSARVEKTAIPLSEILEELASLGVKRVSVILDAGFGKRRRGKSLGMTREAEGIPVYPKPAPSVKGHWALLIAAQEGKCVREMREFGHGLLTHFLLEALDGKADRDGDARITLGEVDAFLGEKLPILSGMVSAPQEPWSHIGDPGRELVPPVQKKTPVEPPAEQPGEEPAEQPGEEPAEQPGEEPAEQPGEEPAEQPGEEPAEQPGEEPAEQPGEEPAEEPGEESAEQPGEEPAEEEIWRNSDQKVVLGHMKRLISELKVTRKEYDRKKAELEEALAKDNPEELAIYQAMLKWLVLKKRGMETPSEEPGEEPAEQPGEESGEPTPEDGGAEDPEDAGETGPEDGGESGETE